ncbi:MAG: TolC family protein, partial [Pseudomonas sp.]
MKLLMPTLLALAVSACAVGPDYQEPATEPAKLSSLEAGDYDRTRFEAIWWQQFDDPTLNQLVQQSLKENRELR